MELGRMTISQEDSRLRSAPWLASPKSARSGHPRSEPVRLVPGSLEPLPGLSLSEWNLRLGEPEHFAKFRSKAKSPKGEVEHLKP